MVSDRLWYRTVLLEAVSSHVPARPATPGMASVRNGELQAGGNSIC